MNKPARLASFCRLCLVKSSDSKVSIFQDQSYSLRNLLQLIELDIDATAEPNAVVCFECIVTLEGFQQFKEQCHTNDEFLKTVPPATNGEEGEGDDAASCASDELEDEPTVEALDQSEDYDAVEVLNDDSEPEEGLVLDEPEVAPAEKIANVEQKSAQKRSFPKPYSSGPKLDIEEIDRQCKKYKIKTYRQGEGPKITDLQVLRDSYPDYFYFERAAKAQYFKLVYYGERFHMSNCTERYTYWMCVHRKRRRCPAQVCVQNDYTNFERRYEHNHGELKEREEKAYTPRQALPELFKICRDRVMQRTAMRRKKMLDRRLQQMEEGPDTDEEVNSKPTAGTKRVLKECGVLDGLEESEEDDSDEWN